MNYATDAIQVGHRPLSSGHTLAGTLMPGDVDVATPTSEAAIGIQQPAHLNRADSVVTYEMPFQ
jgi:hypothetical protein